VLTALTHLLGSRSTGLVMVAGLLQLMKCFPPSNLRRAFFSEFFADAHAMIAQM
jgi:hypothetical protein